MSEKRIIFVDASLLKQSACKFRVWRLAVEGYRGKINGIDIEYGQAFHIFAKTFTDTDGNAKLAQTEAIKYFTNTPYTLKPKKEWMTLDHLKKTCFDWMMHWQTTNDPFRSLRIEGAQTTELKFDIPYISTPEVEIHLAGTIDSICKMKSAPGFYIIKDYKTTSSWDHKEFLRNYELDPQLIFYRLAIRLMAQHYPHSLFADMEKTGVGGVIEGVFVSGRAPSEIDRTNPFFYKKDRLDKFESMVYEKCTEIANQVSFGTLPQREGQVNGVCISTKFGCPFFDACAAPDEIAEGHILRSQFIQRQYNPLLFH